MTNEEAMNEESLKMKPDGGGRRTVEEIKAEARGRYGVDLVPGFDRISEFSAAERNEEWVASFLDARRAYYLRQSDEGPLQWLTEPVPEDNEGRDVVFVVSIGLGYGSAFPQPSGKFDLYIDRTKRLLSFRVTKEDELWRGNGATLAYKVRRKEVAPPHNPLKLDAFLQEESMATFGLGFIRLPGELVTPGRPVEFTLRGFNRQSSKRWFKLDIEMFARVLLKARLDDGLEAVCDDERRPRSGDKEAYFGELHTHSGEKRFGDGRGCGTGTVEENYEYARDVSNLDFFALTDHDWQIEDEEDWLRLVRAADRHCEEGRFVTLPAVEWTSARYGHRNVYFKRGGSPPFVSCGPKNSIEESRTPAELWDGLRGAGVEAITIPHHVKSGFFPVDWSYHDPQFERLVEVYSTWGNFETDKVKNPGWAADREDVAGAREANLMGHRLGFIASSDGHDGNAGNAQWSNRQPHIHHRLGSGRAVVWAEDFTRAGIFDALYRRRCYATTGAHILVDFKVNGNWMGSEVRVKGGGPLRIEAAVQGTDDIARIDLIESAAIVQSWRPLLKREWEMEWEGEAKEEESPLFYYLRLIQEDGEMAWTSPCFVSF